MIFKHSWPCFMSIPFLLFGTGAWLNNLSVESQGMDTGPVEIVQPHIYVPSSYHGASSYSLLVLFHGEGSEDKEFARSFYPVAEKEKTILVSFRGPLTLETGGFAWQETGDKEKADFSRLYTPLVLAVRKIRKTYSIEPKRLVLAGFSHGAALALDLGLHFPGLFRGGVICISGKKYNLSPTMDCLIFSAAIGQRVYLIQDIEGDPDAGMKAYEILNDQGVRSVLHEFNMGHDLPSHFDWIVSKALTWLKQ